MSPQNRILQNNSLALDLVVTIASQIIKTVFQVRSNKMGIPYSNQINSAFDQVTPLVAAGFDVLRTSRNISILLAAIQVLTVLLLGFILVALVGLLITVSPDLEQERQAIVTPAVKWLALWFIDRNWLKALIWTVLVGSLIGGTAGWYLTRDLRLVEAEENETEQVDRERERGEASSE